MIIHKLTQRENQVLLELIKGRSNKQIAKALDIELATVKKYVYLAYKKMGVKTRSQAIRYIVLDHLDAISRMPAMQAYEAVEHLRIKMGG